MISMETVDYIARVLEIRGTFFRMVARASREHPHRVIRQTVLAIYVHVLPVALAIARPSYDHFQPHSLGESSITAVLSRRLTTVRQNIRASILRTSCGFGRLATFINRMYTPCTPCSRRIASRSNTSSTDGSFVSCAFSDIFSSRFSAPLLSFPSDLEHATYNRCTLHLLSHVRPPRTLPFVRIYPVVILHTLDEPGTLRES